jgi:hypothetical protein
MIEYADLYETNEWEYFLSKEVVNVSNPNQKKKVYWVQAW